MGRSNLPRGGHMTRGGLTGLCRRFNRPMQCELGLLFVMHFQVTFLHALVQGEFAYVQGSSCVSFWLVPCVLLVVFALFLSMFCLGCVEPLPLPKGSETCSSSSDLALCPSLAFNHLLEFSFISSFSFLFPFGYKSCVLSMHSSRGRLRTMCGSRIGGWSLPCVMSD
jgi:hypothetical protein